MARKGRNRQRRRAEESNSATENTPAATDRYKKTAFIKRWERTEKGEIRPVARKGRNRQRQRTEESNSATKNAPAGTNGYKKSSIHQTVGTDRKATRRNDAGKGKRRNIGKSNYPKNVLLTSKRIMAKN